MSISLSFAAAHLLEVEVALCLLKPVPLYVFIAFWILFAVLFLAIVDSAHTVLARGFATLSILVFALYPAGKFFSRRLLWLSAGETDLMESIQNPQLKAEALARLGVDIATSGKFVLTWGIVFAILAFFSWCYSQDY